ncbi:hypothetical protein D3C85_1487230 [compost metagenome]
MQATCQPHQQPDRRPTQQAAQYGADSAGVGNGTFDMQTEIGAHDAEHRENDVAQ